MANEKINNRYIEQTGTTIHEVSETRPPLVFIDQDMLVRKRFYNGVKRIFDIVFGVISGVISIIPIAVLAIIIFIDDPHGSPFFVQERVGKDGKVFRFYKLRSMYVDAEDHLDELLDQNDMKSSPAFKMKDDPRITRVGKVLRKTSLDELPQIIFNVIKGDMSFVGPRPPLVREVEMYNAYQKQRLMVKPGLTCTWQIQPDRSSLSFDFWLYLDLKYIQERSFLGDLKIILKTFRAMINGYGC